MGLRNRLQERSESAERRDRRGQPVHDGPNPDLSRLGLAPATGIALPSLKGMPGRIPIRTGDRDVIRCARGLVAAGTIAPALWKRAQGEPGRLLQLALESWINEGYGGLPRAKQVDAILVQGMATRYGDDVEVDPDQSCIFHIVMEARAIWQTYLGRTLSILEKIDPRLPVTFHDQLVYALYATSYAFSFRSIAEEGIEEWAAAMQLASELEDAGEGFDPTEAVYGMSTAELDATVARIVPACLRRKPYRRAELTRKLQSVKSERVLRWFAWLREIEELAKPLRANSDFSEALRSLSDDIDLMSPWPAYMIGIEPHDTLDGVWDDQSTSRVQMGEPAMPSYVIRFDVRDAATVARARQLVVRSARLAGLAQRLLNNLPEPRQEAA